MIHLLFLLVSFGLVIIGQQLLLLLLGRVQSWLVRRSLQLLGLALPLTVLILFTLGMASALIMPAEDHLNDQAIHEQWLAGVIGFILLIFPAGLALVINLLRLAWLYLRMYNRSWTAPPELVCHTAAINRVELRLWYSANPFAFNLPGLRLCVRPKIVLSTAMVEQLDMAELQAVLSHEYSHLKRWDFDVLWLATWWRDAFFYLPAGHRFLQGLRADQELACDEQVVRQGGVSSALNLAAALLKVWEVSSSARLSSSRPGKGVLAGAGGFGQFEAPGLASRAVSGFDLTEQRLKRLLQMGESGEFVLPDKDPLVSRVKAGGVVGGSLGLWLIALEFMHAMMLPMGCVLAPFLF